MTSIISAVCSAVWNDPVAAGLITAGILAAVSAGRRMAKHWRRTRTIIFVSSGGTCRDPMAKAILEKLLRGRKLKHPLVVKAAALGPLSDSSNISYAARRVIADMYGDDPLSSEVPVLLTREMIDDADLILVMDRSLLSKTLPSNKSYVLKEFFGLTGAIADPYPDGKDTATLARYRACAEDLRDVLAAHLDDLLTAVAVI